MPVSCEIQFAGERLVFGADRTLWWPARRVLMAADLHAGKTEHMRRHGLAIPGGSLEADLAVLDAGATRLGAERLIFLGDLFHSEINAEWDIFAAWSRGRTYAVELVRGNHDRFLTDAQLAAAGLTVHAEPYDLAPFSLRHHPLELPDPKLFVIAGHLHPVTWLTGPARDRLRLPCFWLAFGQLILPAFGSFTGGLVIRASDGDRVYPCAPDRSTLVA